MMNREQILSQLRKVQGTDSLQNFADLLKVSPAYLCNVYAGRREPGRHILELMGLRKIKTVSILYVEKEKAMPEKKQEAENKPPRYVAIKKAVMSGQNCAGVMCSHEMAKRIARLLNEDERS